MSGAAQPPRTIAALYVEKGGVYYGLDGVDPWDEERDARLYDGPHPVVAHPPCNVWGQLAPVNEARYGTPVGHDKGCFAAALEAVETWGGVLEHPAYTLAFHASIAAGDSERTRGKRGLDEQYRAEDQPEGHPPRLLRLRWLAGRIRRNRVARAARRRLLQSSLRVVVDGLSEVRTDRGRRMKPNGSGRLFPLHVKPFLAERDLSKSGVGLTA